MAKEDDLKKIELKVSVDCCDGCKKKVLKALSIKGVLKMEIHPTLPCVTVTGNVDSDTLIKRLAKCGKVAEVLPAEDKKQEKGADKAEKADGNKEKAKDEKSGKKVTGEQEKSSKCCEENKNSQAPRVDKEKSLKVMQSCSENKGRKQLDEALKNANATTPATTTTTMAAAAVTAPLPQMNCFVNPGMMQGPVLTQAPFPRVYYPMDPYMVAATYPMANAYPANTYPASPTIIPPDAYLSGTYSAAAAMAPPPLYVREHCCHGQHQHTSTQPLPPRMTDYFNDDNTASCHVM